ncbi:MAG: hypothetical protein ACLU3N_07400 [Lachnospiraceae bacterium]
MAFSNPCFEYWYLLHFVQIMPISKTPVKLSVCFRPGAGLKNMKRTRMSFPCFCPINRRLPEEPATD